VVQIELRSKDGKRPESVLTRPVAFRPSRLDTLLVRSNAPVVDPFLFEATPCAPLPGLVYGLAEAPRLLVEWYWGQNFAGTTSPFRGTDDVFETIGVPVELAGRPDERIIVAWALPDPREALAPPTRRTWLE
jgi:hypothetical protein